VPPTSDLPILPPGSRAEQLLLIGQLMADLASIPIHLVVFLFTRRRHQRGFVAAMTEARS